LLGDADYYTLRLFKSRRGQTTDATTSSSITPSRNRNGEAVVQFVHLLSDQQITTGIALLIAAVANRCRLSLHEFHIVTNLAYFSLSSHVLSLRIITSYLAKRTIIRRCRIVITGVFFCLFRFAYLLDGLFVTDETGSQRNSDWSPTGLSSGTTLQCVFERAYPRHEDLFFYDRKVLVLLVLAATHILTLQKIIGRDLRRWLSFAKRFTGSNLHQNDTVKLGPRRGHARE
jgi:hypothetical protein